MSVTFSIARDHYLIFFLINFDYSRHVNKQFFVIIKEQSNPF